MADIDQDEIAKLAELQKLFQSSDPSKVPSTKELLEMLEASGLSEEMKEELQSTIKGVPQVLGGYESSTFLAIGFVAIICSIILFFGCKLYKSIKDKEIKREEKKKLKQMKKKK